MFSKFDIDSVDPLSKLGRKVEPPQSESAVLRRWRELDHFTDIDHDLPLEYRVQRAEQKAVVGPTTWPELRWIAEAHKPVPSFGGAIVSAATWAELNMTPADLVPAGTVVWVKLEPPLYEPPAIQKGAPLQATDLRETWEEKLDRLMAALDATELHSEDELEAFAAMQAHLRTQP